MSVAQVTEMVSPSSKRFGEAHEDGIARADGTLRGVASVWDKQQSVERKRNGESEGYLEALNATLMGEC